MNKQVEVLVGVGQGDRQDLLAEGIERQVELEHPRFGEDPVVLLADLADVDEVRLLVLGKGLDLVATFRLVGQLEEADVRAVVFVLGAGAQERGSRLGVRLAGGKPSGPRNEVMWVK